MCRQYAYPPVVQVVHSAAVSHSGNLALFVRHRSAAADWFTESVQSLQQYVPTKANDESEHSYNAEMKPTKPIQQLNDSNYIVATTLQQLHCSIYIVATTLQQLHCSNYIVATTLQQIHCINYIVATTLQQIHCSNYIVATTLQQLYCSNYIVATILQQLHCSNYIVATTLKQQGKR